MSENHEIAMNLSRALAEAGVRASAITTADGQSYLMFHGYNGHDFNLVLTDVQQAEDRRSPMDRVRDEAIATARERGEYQDGDENLLGLECTRFMHMAYDAGRPSDAMRSTVRSYLADPAQFRSDFHTSREA